MRRHAVDACKRLTATLFLSVKTNIFANYAGAIWIALMGLVFVPTYIKLMGIEAYGLIGMFGTLMGLFSILDLGLSPTVNREMAIRSADPTLFHTARPLLRTVEVVYWGIAAMIGIVVTALSFPIAHYWVNPEKLTENDVQRAVMMMGLALVFRWPYSMYQGGLMGLQCQVLINVVNSISATVRGIGAVLILWLVSPSIQAFFFWQIVMSALDTLVSAFLLWKRLPPSRCMSEFNISVLTDVRRFAGGMLAINVVTSILMYTDKVILSKLLSLEDYGFYMLAWTVCMALYNIIHPIYHGVYPHFCHLAMSRDLEALKSFYHKSCRLMSSMVLPFGFMLMLFSEEILRLWTNNPTIAGKTYKLVAILAVGTTLNAMMNVPYALQLAFGWTSLAFWTNLIAVIIFVPSIFILVDYYGVIGGPIAYALLNVGYVTLPIRVIHSKLLHGDLWKWYLHDIGGPLFIVMPLAICLRSFLHTPSDRIWLAIWVMGVLSVLFAAQTLIIPDLRKPALQFLRNKILETKALLSH